MMKERIPLHRRKASWRLGRGGGSAPGWLCGEILAFRSLAGPVVGPGPDPCLPVGVPRIHSPPRAAASRTPGLSPKLDTVSGDQESSPSPPPDFPPSCRENLGTAHPLATGSPPAPMEPGPLIFILKNFKYTEK